MIVFPNTITQYIQEQFFSRLKNITCHSWVHNMTSWCGGCVCKRGGIVCRHGHSRCRRQSLTTKVYSSNSSVSNDGNEDSYEFTYQGSDGRKKATFEQALKSGVHETLQAYVDHAPWEFGYQMAEKNLVWHDDLKERLYARVASEELNITEEELVQYLDRLRSLMPDASEKLANMPIKTLSRLITNIDTIPEKLMRLKMIFPRANASLLAIRNPELVLGFDSDHLQTIADILNDMFPRLEVDKLVEENPSMLDIEELRVAMAEAQRIMPQLDIQKAMASDPQIVLSFQRGSQLIPYDPVSPEERQRDEDEYNQYYT